jgi:hypothetical protein
LSRAGLSRNPKSPYHSRKIGGEPGKDPDEQSRQPIWEDRGALAGDSHNDSNSSTGVVEAASGDGLLSDDDIATPLSPLMARLDVAMSGLIALVAAAIAVAMPQLVASGGIDIERDFATLPAYLVPQLSFGALAVVALFSLIPAVRRLKLSTGAAPADESDRLQRAGVMTVITAAYAAGMNTLGYVFDTMLMTVIVSFYLGLRNPLAFIPGALIAPFVIRFIFERMLLISLPPSRIEILGNIEEAVLGFFSRLLLH